MGEILAIVWDKPANIIVGTWFGKDKTHDQIIEDFKNRGLLMLGRHVVFANVVSSVLITHATQPGYEQLAPVGMPYIKT